VSVVDRKKAAFWPIRHFTFFCRLGNVKDNTHAIFVVVSLDAPVRISCVALYNSVTFICKFGPLIIKKGIYQRVVCIRPASRRYYLLNITSLKSGVKFLNCISRLIRGE
jgi:hypothetical protein